MASKTKPEAASEYDHCRCIRCNEPAVNLDVASMKTFTCRACGETFTPRDVRAKLNEWESLLSKLASSEPRARMRRMRAKVRTKKPCCDRRRAG